MQMGIKYFHYRRRETQYPHYPSVRLAGWPDNLGADAAANQTGSDDKKHTTAAIISIGIHIS